MQPHPCSAAAAVHRTMPVVAQQTSICIPPTHPAAQQRTRTKRHTQQSPKAQRTSERDNSASPARSSISRRAALQRADGAASGTPPPPASAAAPACVIRLGPHRPPRTAPQRVGTPDSAMRCDTLHQHNFVDGRRNRYRLSPIIALSTIIDHYRYYRRGASSGGGGQEGAGRASSRGRALDVCRQRATQMRIWGCDGACGRGGRSKG